MFSMKFWWLIMLFSGVMLVKFLKNFVHMMNLLVILECIMMLNFLLLMMAGVKSSLSFFSFGFFFMINVMEACVGLGMLIFLSRNVGEEYKFIL